MAYIYQTDPQAVAGAANMNAQANWYKLVEISTTQDYGYTICNSVDDVPMGVLVPSDTNKGNAIGEPISVALLSENSIIECKVGTAVARGAAIGPKADGTVLTAASGKAAIGFAKTAGAVNQLVEVQIRPHTV